jgi:predicted nucleic acid-binding Zn ribbon protein
MAYPCIICTQEVNKAYSCCSPECDKIHKVNQAAERRATMVKNVTVNADSQVDDYHRNNFLLSCEAHGGEMIQIVADYRKTHNFPYSHPNDCDCPICGDEMPQDN